MGKRYEKSVYREGNSLKGQQVHMPQRKFQVIKGTL
jgi:hypothetical protein